MKKVKYIKISIVVFTFIFMLWLSSTFFSIYKFSQTDNSTIFVSTDIKISSTINNSSELDEDKEPVYFNIFKFVTNFIPISH